MFAGFRFNNIFCAATNFRPYCQLSPNSRNEEMMGDGFSALLLPVCFEQETSVEQQGSGKAGPAQ